MNAVAHWIRRAAGRLVHLKEDRLIDSLEQELRGNSRDPLFFDQRINLLEFLKGDSVSPLVLARGFYVAEILRPSDRVLDIGYGDAFFTQRFYAPLCQSIDAIDLSASAIESAKRYYPSRKINYRKSNVLEDDFPAGRYDIVVWNAVYGTFSDGDLAKAFQKISSTLQPEGIFMGSVSLGEPHEGLTERAVASEWLEMLRPSFAHTSWKELVFPIKDRIRRDLFWRVSTSSSALQARIWRP